MKKIYKLQRSALINNPQTLYLLSIKSWLDFKEGEQLQLKFNDDTGVLTSDVNTTLIYPNTESICEVIAKAFSGNLEKSNKKVKIN